MKRHWLVYMATGITFGVADYLYLSLLYPNLVRQVFGPAGEAGQWLAFVVLNLGVWLVPAVPIALYEGRRSGSRVLPALASMLTWCAAIVAYYLANAAEIAFWGLPARMEMHISNRQAPEFWGNWASVLIGDILSGMLEWMAVAVIGGAITGFLAGLLAPRPSRAR